MEVTPEMYAWLVSLNVIDCVKTLRDQQEASFIIPKRTLELLIGGKYWTRILINLQETYNKFYKLKLNYVDNLSQLKAVNEEDDYIPNSVKYYNWHIIAECLNHFGVIYTEEQILTISNGSIELIMELINTLYTLTNEFMKRSDEPSKRNTKEDRALSAIPHVSLNNNDKKTIISHTEPNTNSVANMNQSKIPPLQHQNETININTLNPAKEYERCDSPLEFFIVSLCKNFELTTRQSVALLSNNRKYLAILCSKGLKGKYTPVLHWIQDLSTNSRYMMKLLTSWGDGIGIGYATIGTALCSKNREVVLNASTLLAKINCDIGCDWDWFIKEGLDSIIFAIVKHESLMITMFKLLHDFTRNRMNDFVNELRKKSKTKDKKKLYDLYSVSLRMLKQISEELFTQLKFFLFEFCLDEQEDKSIAVSLLCDAWYYFDPLEMTVIDSILYFIKKCTRDKIRINSASTAILQSFSLLERFGNNKKDGAPPLYKTLVFLFLENYDHETKRELMLVNFEKFFNSHKIIPIDIFIEPFLKQIKSSTNYSLCDFIFLFKILEHPRITGNNITDIIEFILEVSMQNLIYSRTANLILSLIFDKGLISTLCNEDEVSHLMILFKNYIINMINIYLSNVSGVEDKAILETPYDIMLESIPEINQGVHDSLCEAVKEYRQIKGNHSNCLLAMLWFFDDNDEYLLQLEEMFRVIYEPVEVSAQKQKIIEEEKDKKNFKKKNLTVLDDLQSKKRALDEYKQKEESIQKDKQIKRKKALEEQRKRASIMLGIEVQQLEPIKKQPFLITQTDSKGLLSLASEDDLSIKRVATMMSVDRRKELEVIMENEKEAMKVKSINDLVLEEGSIIKTITSKMIKKQGYITSEVYKNFILPINLEEEEVREIKAINGYNYQYKKNIMLYFRTYYNEVTQTMAKSNLLKMFRDKGYSKNQISLDELTIAIRNIFGDNINEINYDQFCNLLIQLSYLIYTKQRYTLTISECYGNLLRHFVPSKLTPATIAMNKQMKPVIDLIKQKLTNPIDDDDSYFNMPPGFKILEKTSVKYNSRLAPHFLSFLTEGNYICFEILEDIIFKAFNTSTIEPYVKVTQGDNVEIDPAKIKPWTKDLTIAYMLLPTEYETSGIEVTDCMDAMLKKICKGRDKQGNIFIPPVIKNEIEESKKYLETEAAKEDARLRRQREIKSKVEEFKEEKLRKKKEQAEQLKRERIQRLKNTQAEIKETNEKNQKKFEEVLERKKAIEEEKHNKLLEEQEKMKEDLIKKVNERKEFFNKQKRRLKEQFKMIQNQKEQMYKQSHDTNNLFPISSKSPEMRASYLEKDKAYFDFERNLNGTIKQLINREDIKAVFDKYQPHFKLVFDIYSKIGYNKISFYSREAIRENEFKEFLMNYSVLGLLVNTEQMKYIFKKITYESEKNKDDQDFFTFDEFLMSIGYLAIVSKFANRTRKILPSDIDNTDPNAIESFISFLGFKIPYNKMDLEGFINDRRAMSMKNILKMQREIRKEKVKEFKQTEFEKEMENRKENRRLLANDSYHKKVNEEREKLKAEQERSRNGEQDENEDDHNASVKMDTVNTVTEENESKGQNSKPKTKGKK